MSSQAIVKLIEKTVVSGGCTPSGVGREISQNAIRIIVSRWRDYNARH
jgi:hypothetical protein